MGSLTLVIGIIYKGKARHTLDEMWKFYPILIVHHSAFGWKPSKFRQLAITSSGYHVYWRLLVILLAF